MIRLKTGYKPRLKVQGLKMDFGKLPDGGYFVLRSIEIMADRGSKCSIQPQLNDIGGAIFSISVSCGFCPFWIAALPFAFLFWHHNFANWRHPAPDRVACQIGVFWLGGHLLIKCD